MSDFGKGFLLGSWLNSDSDGGGNGSDGSGCAYGCLIVIGIALLGIVGTILTIFVAIIPQVYGAFMNVYDNLLVKIALFPSTFDMLIEWGDHNYIRAIVLFAGVVLLFLITRGTRKLTTIGFIYFLIQTGILLVRFVGTIIYAISISIFGESDFFNENKTDLIVTENVPSNENVNSISDAMSMALSSDESGIDFGYRQHTDGLTMSDSLGKGKYANYLYIDVDGLNIESQSEDRSLFINIEPKSTFYFLGLKETDEFKTTISYVPITEAANWQNQSTFTIIFFINEKEVKSVTLTPKNPVIPIDISLEDADSFSIFVKGNVTDRSIITLLNPIFSAKM